MFEIAFSIGIFSYSIFLLGLANFLYPVILIPYTIFFWTSFIVWRRKQIISLFPQLFKNRSAMYLFFVGYIFLQALIAIVGLFGPEIGFDATWYHLTLPKLYLMYHAVLHIPGTVLYYSDMPHLTEMLYAVGLSFGNDLFARSIHFLFGLLSCVVLYKVGRKFFSANTAILLPVIFYSNLVVGWESISGYIDLSRSFFTFLTLLAFLSWAQTKDLPDERHGKRLFFYAAISMGLTLSTKLLALPDLLIYSVAIWWVLRQEIFIVKIKAMGAFVGLALLVCLPWFTFAFIHTGNPFYPMFSNYDVGNYWQIFNPLFLFQSVWATFAYASDPINPFFLAITPFVLLRSKKLWREVPLLVILTVGGLIAWYITPQTGGGRYILPYLGVFSVLGVYVMHQLSVKWQRVFTIFIMLVALVSLMYRAGAIAKFLPVIFHKESKAHFMSKHLQFQLGDFYDIDNYFATHIQPSDRVLLYNFHNLYYVDFPFIDSNWVKKGDSFNYVAVQGVGMPERFKYWQLVYSNTITQVRLYTFHHQVWFY